MEYEQKVMPDGRFAVDGFVLVYDVSMVPNRSPEKQTEFSGQILSTSTQCPPQKPCVLAETKCAEAQEILVRELERLVNRKGMFNYLCNDLLGWVHFIQLQNISINSLPYSKFQTLNT